MCSLLGPSFKYLLALGLALLLAANSAFAAALGICDALDEKSGHGSSSPYHHQHDHEHGHETTTDGLDHTPVPDDVAGQTVDGDQHHDHCHAHASFLTLTADESGIGLHPSRSPQVARPVNPLASASLAGLERPPRPRSA